MEQSKEYFVKIYVNGKKIIGKVISYDPLIKKYHISTLEDDYWVAKDEIKPVDIDTENRENKSSDVKKDSINPDHYKNGCSLECIDVMCLTFGEEEVFHYCCINAFKYLWRHKNKNGLEDVKKADWYISKAYDLFSRNEDNIHYYEERLNTLSNMLTDAFSYYQHKNP